MSRKWWWDQRNSCSSAEAGNSACNHETWTREAQYTGKIRVFSRLESQEREGRNPSGEKRGKSRWGRMIKNSDPMGNVLRISNYWEFLITVRDAGTWTTSLTELRFLLVFYFAEVKEKLPHPGGYTYFQMLPLVMPYWATHLVFKVNFI